MMDTHFMNGHFKATVYTLLTLGIVLAAGVLTATLQNNAARRSAVDAVQRAIAHSDSIRAVQLSAQNDSLLKRLDLLQGGLEVNQARIYRYTPEREVLGAKKHRK